MMSLAKTDNLLQANGFFMRRDRRTGGPCRWRGCDRHAAGRFAVTVNLQVSFLAPAKGTSLIARARALQVGSTIGVARVDVASVAHGAETPCAIATVTLRGIDFPVK